NPGAKVPTAIQIKSGRNCLDGFAGHCSLRRERNRLGIALRNRQVLQAAIVSLRRRIPPGSASTETERAGPCACANWPFNESSPRLPFEARQIRGPKSEMRNKFRIRRFQGLKRRQAAWFCDSDFGPSSLFRTSSFGFRILGKVTIPLRNDSENSKVIFARALISSPSRRSTRACRGRECKAGRWQPRDKPRPFPFRS